MAINLNDNIKVLAGKPTDARYLNNLTPYASVSAANTAIGSTLRYTGLTVNVAGVEYWYADGILDGNLVVKDSGLASTGLTTAINGLTKVGNAVKLGGTLTGVTTLNGSTANLLQYGGDYSAGYGPRTIVDAGYVTGKTNAIATNLATNYYNKTQINSYTGQTDTRIDNLEIIGASAVTGATNGLSKVGRQVKLGGALTGDTTICGGDSYQLNLGGLSAGQRLDDMYINAIGTFFVDSNGISMQSQTFTYTDCGATKDGITYGANYSSGFTARSLVDAEWVTGKTSTSGVQTANNGLTKLGTNVVLGGTLTGNTCILTTSRSLTFSGGSASYFTCSKTGADDMAVCQTASCFRVVGTGTCESCLGLSSVSGIAHLYGNCCARIDGTSCVELCGNTSRIVLAANYIKLTSNVCMATTPNTGAVSDAVLVWNSGDKEIKCLAITSSFTPAQLPDADFYAPDLANVPNEVINWIS
jgi:hypothetical protein